MDYVMRSPDIPGCRLYVGWQYQQSTPTVQCIVEEASTQITKLEREELQLAGASRTDAGVHAWCQGVRDAAKHFVGAHDFSAFANASHNDRTPNPVKNIFHFDVNEMVALLLQVGKEAASHDIVPKILASRVRKVLAKHALFVPPHGLCLMYLRFSGQFLGHFGVGNFRS
ncbi:uncharacterized protein [Primulina eburnea]|uniref:uncharacterized protein n=1 Tax=Primulina eburnea TaxID=1245227 RepID=UPI003C6C313E